MINTFITKLFFYLGRYDTSDQEELYVSKDMLENWFTNKIKQRKDYKIYQELNQSDNDDTS